MDEKIRLKHVNRTKVKGPEIVDYVWEHVRDKVCKNGNLTKKDLRIILEYFLLGIKRALVQNHSVFFYGFGTFFVKLFRMFSKRHEEYVIHGKVYFHPCVQLETAVSNITDENIRESDAFLELE